MIPRHPARQCQLLLAVLAALGLHVFFVWLLVGPAHVVESIAPGHRLTVRLLKPVATHDVPAASVPPVVSPVRSRRAATSAPVVAPARSASASTEPTVPTVIESTTEQPAAASAPPAAPLRIDRSVLRAAAAQSKGAVALLAEASGVELPSSEVAVVAQLESAIAHSGKPSCLAANPTGSLLSLPLIAFAAITSQCK